MNSLDTFCLRGLSVVVVGVIGMLAIAAMPVKGTQPVKLYHAKPVASECGDDWICTLAAEREAKRSKGYSAKERNRMNQLIARVK